MRPSMRPAVIVPKGSTRDRIAAHMARTCAERGRSHRGVFVTLADRNLAQLRMAEHYATRFRAYFARVSADPTLAALELLAPIFAKYM